LKTTGREGLGLLAVPLGVGRGALGVGFGVWVGMGSLLDLPCRSAIQRDLLVGLRSIQQGTKVRAGLNCGDLVAIAPALFRREPKISRFPVDNLAYIAIRTSRTTT
jgi:hypothetical protein